MKNWRITAPACTCSIRFTWRLAGIADGLHSLDSVAPDQFQQSEYYQSYFRSVVGGDELQFMLNVDGAVLGLSLGRSTALASEQGRLLCVRDWVLAAMRRHTQLLPPQGPAAEAVAGDLATCWTASMHACRCGKSKPRA
jgi:hypothetical protein